jgi:hypothetical protein
MALSRNSSGWGWPRMFRSMPSAPSSWRRRGSFASSRDQNSRSVWAYFSASSTVCFETVTVALFFCWRR